VFSAAGIAYGENGDLYIADRDGERIDVLHRNGKLEVLAGPGCRPGAMPPSGYADGVAQEALFDQPSSLALGKRGELYIADTGNHSIRALIGSQVYTLAGSTHPGVADGFRERAQFVQPTGVAVDEAGNVFVADPGSGIREIDIGGNVSTLSVQARKPFGISVAGPRAPSATLFVSDEIGLAIYTMAYKVTQRFSDSSDADPSTLHLQGMRPIGEPHGLAALNDAALLYTDPKNNAVRFIDTRMFIGNIIASRRALLGEPSAIAISPDRKVAVSTSYGIMLLSNLNIRLPFMPTPEKLWPDDFTSLRSKYTIAYVGNSFAWWNTDWEDSIEGQLETAFDAKWGLADPISHLRVLPIVLPGATISSAEQYLEAVADLGFAHMAILQIEASFIGNGVVPDDKQVPIRIDLWHNALMRSMQKLKRHLDGRHIPLFVVIHPEEFELLAHDTTLERSVVPDLRRQGIQVIDLYPAFAAAMRSSHLWGLRDKHFESSARRLVAENIARYIKKPSFGARPVPKN